MSAGRESLGVRREPFCVNREPPRAWHPAAPRALATRSFHSSCPAIHGSRCAVHGSRFTLHATLAALLLAGCASPSPRTNAWQACAPSGHFAERERAVAIEPDARCVINVAGDYRASRPDSVVFYALPNGNTIEQTAGCAMREGLDWHYDIQHVAAQTRWLRARQPDRNIVLVYLEANPKSWPSWRKNHDGADERIEAMLAELWPADDRTRWTLTGHSGGGSLTFGYLNAVDAIPDRVERIAFLDSNYGFDAQLGHGAKLADWLRRDPSHTLAILAYDDRNIMLDGKKVVSDTGGTFRATVERTIPDLAARGTTLEESTAAPWRVWTDKAGQVDIRVHTNPDNKILHTVMVGEMNGFMHAMTVNTPLKDASMLREERLYTDFVQAAPMAVGGP